MSEHPLGFEVALSYPYEQAIDIVTTVLKTEGFGVLTRIDVHKTLQEKLNVEFRPYAILGVCNPPLAYKALSLEPAAGLLLPCNVTIEEMPDGGSLVRIANPQAIFLAGQFSEPGLAEVAQLATERLLRVSQTLRSSNPQA